MHLIEVAFKGNRKEFFTWDGEEPPPLRAPIIVEADRGEDLGLVHAVGELAKKRSGGCAHGCGETMPSRKAVRVAGPHEVRQGREVRAQDDQARQRAADRVKAHGLVMKLSDAEWQWDRKKLTLYFTADRRVDFRNLVRDLAAAFRTRIELKQYGVRDEAKRLDGVGRCGRQFCSSSWLPELRPVNLGVAKDQHLSLNPSQISGACGRLMCCLRYEHEFYVKSRKRFPKEGKVLTTARGEEKVIANDIFNERVTLRAADGETTVILLSQLRVELAAKGQPLPGGGSSQIAQAPGDPTDGTSMLDEDQDAETALQGASIDAAESALDEEGEVDTSLFDADWPTVRPDTPAASTPARTFDRPRARSSASGAPARRPAPAKRPSASDTAQGSEASPTPAGPPRTRHNGPSSAEGASPPPPTSSGDASMPDAPRRRRGRRGGRRGRGTSNGGDGEAHRGPQSGAGGPEPPATEGNHGDGDAGSGPTPPAG